MDHLKEFDKDTVILTSLGFVFGLILVTFGIIKTVIVALCTFLPIIISKNRSLIREWVIKK